MLCPDILARTLTKPSTGNGSKPYAYGNSWQYHSRSDRHSKVMCWGVTLDLMLACPLLREHVSTGKVSVGINHEMSDFRNKKKKNLDLVLCRSTESGTFGGSKSGRQAARTFAELAPIYGIALTDHERSLLDTLPPLKIGKVSSVLLAVEAKAAMTAFHKARPRLKDELTSSHQTIHGDTDEAIAAGLVMVNTASEFVSPDMNKFTIDGTNTHVSFNVQPKCAQAVVEGLRELQRRSKRGDEGFDGIGVILLECANNGSPVKVTSPDPVLLPSNDDFDYSRFIHRLAQLYSNRFQGQ